MLGLKRKIVTRQVLRLNFILNGLKHDFFFSRGKAGCFMTVPLVDGLIDKSILVFKKPAKSANGQVRHQLNIVFYTKLTVFLLKGQQGTLPAINHKKRFASF